MHKHEQVFLTSSRERGTTTLAQLAQHIEASQDADAGIVQLPGSFGDTCDGHCLPECETYRVTDLDAIIDSLSEQWGVVSEGQLVSDAGMSAAITVQAKCSRVDDQTFQLPSAAAWVVDVWFDDLHADPGFHYEVETDRLITTTVALPSGVVVEAVYFNKAV
jgi:hypothetical protein